MRFFFIFHLDNELKWKAPKEVVQKKKILNAYLASISILSTSGYYQILQSISIDPLSGPSARIMYILNYYLMDRWHFPL